MTISNALARLNRQRVPWLQLIKQEWNSIASSATEVKYLLDHIFRHTATLEEFLRVLPPEASIVVTLTDDGPWCWWWGAGALRFTPTPGGRPSRKRSSASFMRNTASWLSTYLP